ncbi:MAG: hypothetical protein K8I00_07320 [Candidatus Omnitrophica bacterium]|nr:hypothetical protein [Candidatus Omnitrophota bacterium]
MMRLAQLINIEQLPEDVQKKFIPFARNLLELFSGNIRAVAVTGEATGPGYDPKISFINSIVVLQDINFDVFRSALKPVAGAAKQRIAAPLFLSQEYIQNSLDVFPVEFLEIKEKHVLIYGEDIFSTLDIKTEHLRLFCEQQVKGRLIRIRQAYLEVGLQKKGVEALLKDSLSSLLPIFRNLIRLKGETPAVDSEGVINQLTAAFAIDGRPFSAIVRDQSNDEKIAGRDVTEFFEKYINQLQKLARQVDQL